MPTDIGPRIGIDGEKEFRNELNHISQQLRTLGSEMKAVTSEFIGNEKSQEALAAQAGVLTRQIDAQEKKLAGLKNGLAAASDKFGENDTRTLKWAKAVNDATADLNRMRAQLSRTSNEMDDLDKETDDATDAMEKAEKASSGLGSSLKNAFVGGAISGAVQSLIGGMNDLAESTMEYRRIMASLEVSSQNAGYSVEQTTQTFQQLYGVLGDDQTAATTTANLQALGLSQEQLTELTNGAIGAWATYGDSIPIDSLSEAINETIRVGTVTGTFADVLNWAGTSEDDFNSKLQAASSETERANIVLNELAKQGLSDAGKAWQENNDDIVSLNRSQADLNESMADFGEILTPIVAEGKGMLAGFLSGIVAIGQEFQSGGMSGGMQTIQNSLQSLSASLQSNLPIMIQNGLASATAFVRGFLDGMPEVMAAGYSVVNEIVSGVAQNLPNIAISAMQIVTAYVQYLQESFPTMIQTGVDILTNLVQGVLDTIPAMVEELPKVITAIVEYVTSALPQILQAGVDILNEVTQGIIDTIPDLVSKVPQIITAITSTLANNFPQVLESGVQILVQLLAGIFQQLPELVKSIPEIIMAILEAFGALVDGALNVGTNLIKGLWDGIKGAAGWLKDKIAGFCSDILDSIKGFFGINSPSRVMRDQVGKMIGEGMAEGIEGSKRAVLAAANNVNTALLKQQTKIEPISFGKDITYYKTIDQATNTGLYNATAAAVNGMAALSQSAPMQPIVLQVMLDKKIIAQTIFDPLIDVSKQRGVALG